MALCHERRLFPLNKDFCLDCLGVKSTYYASLFVSDRVGMAPENAVRIRMLDPDEPFYVFCGNS